MLISRLSHTCVIATVTLGCDFCRSCLYYACYSLFLWNTSFALMREWLDTS